MGEEWRNNCIAVMGGDSQVGCTMIAQQMAFNMAKLDGNQEILFAECSCQLGGDYYNNEGNCSLDDLKAGLISNRVEELELRQSLIRRDNLSILPGVREPIRAAGYTKASVEALLKMTRDFSSRIFDCGWDLQKEMPFELLRNAVKRYFVVTQQEKCIRRFLYTKEHVLDPLGISGYLIVNKYRRGVTLFSPKELSQMTGYPLAAVISYSDLAWQAEWEHRCLDSTKMKKEMEALLRHIHGKEKKSIWKSPLIFRRTSIK